MSRQISERRKTAFYVGTGMMVVGGLLFASTFVSVAMRIGDFSPMNPGSVAIRGFGGFALIAVGMFVRMAGMLGAAGAGVLLDPERASKELKPYARMRGELFKEEMDAAGIDIPAIASRLGGGGTGRGEAPKQIVMVKCRACGKLNEEDSKFCRECGAAL